MIRRTLLYFGNPCAVCSSVSDEPKLYGGGPILINRLVYNGSHPLRGDILKCQVIRISPTNTLNTKQVMRLVRDQSRVSGLRYELWPPLVQKRPLLFVWCLEMVSSRKWLTGSDRYVLSWWNGEEMIKKVKETHLSDDQDFDVNPILRGAHQILHHANPSLEVVQR